MRTFNINGVEKTIGVDIFELSDIEAVDGYDYHIAILECAKEGMQIERYYNNNSEHQYLTIAKGQHLNFNHYYYRVVPQPKPKGYKPYSGTDLSWIGKTVRLKEQDECVRLVVGISAKSVLIALDSINLDTSLYHFFDFYTWLDGSPCGELV